MNLRAEGALGQLDETEIDRDEQSDRLLRFMDRLKANEFFSSEESKRQFIEELDFERFKNFFFAVNGLLRDIPLRERGMDGESVFLKAQENEISSAFGAPAEDEYPPRFSDKEGLLSELFEHAKQMNQDGDDLEDIALLMSASVNAIHPFADGNGRTSRLIYGLLTRNYEGNDDDKDFFRKILGENGRLILNIDPSNAGIAIEKFIRVNDLHLQSQDTSKPGSIRVSGQTNWQILSDKGISDDDVANFQKYIVGEEGSFGFFAVYQYFMDQERLPEVLEPFYFEGVLRRTVLPLQKILEAVSPEDVHEILEHYWRLKRRNVEILMDSVANPERYPVPESQIITDAHEDETIKEYLQRGIEKAQDRTLSEVNYEGFQRLWPEFKHEQFTQETITDQELRTLSEIKQMLEEAIQIDEEERATLAFDFEAAEQQVSERYTTKLEELEEQFGVTLQMIETDYERVSQLRAEAERQRFSIVEEVHRPVDSISKSNLRQIRTYLDGLDIWSARFSTRRQNESLTDEQQKETDSIYYVTRSGVALRLLQFNLREQGLSGVVQPFAEKIFYIGDDQDISDDAQLGRKIVEYFTGEFSNELEQDEAGRDFKGRVRRYEKNGRILYLNPPDGRMHQGYPIHEIFHLSER